MKIIIDYTDIKQLGLQSTFNGLLSIFCNFIDTDRPYYDKIFYYDPGTLGAGRS